MTIARKVSEVLQKHVALELECLDRLYLNAYVPILQTARGASHFFRAIRGMPVLSSALMAPMTRAFVAKIERFARAEGVDLVTFKRGERTQAYLRNWRGEEGVLYIGKAQERARVLRTVRNPETGQPLLGPGTAMVNHYYICAVDDEFGPFFIKFYSYFPYTAKLCLNGHEYVKRQLAKRGIPFEPLDNGILSCARPDLMQEIAGEVTAKRIDALFRKWLARLPHPFTPEDRADGIRYQLPAHSSRVGPSLLHPPDISPKRPGSSDRNLERSKSGDGAATPAAGLSRQRWWLHCLYRRRDKCGGLCLRVCPWVRPAGGQPCAGAPPALEYQKRYRIPASMLCDS